MAKKSAKKAAKQKRQNQARSRVQAKQNATATTNNTNNNSSSNNNSKHIQQLTAKMEHFSLSDGSGSGSGGLPPLSLVPSGLGNLGSTCYFNSVMQVLGQTYVLGRKLVERADPQYVWQADTVYLEVVSSSSSLKKDEEEEEANEEGHCNDEAEQEADNTSSSIEAYFKADSRRVTLPEPHSLITAFVSLQREIFTGSRTFPGVLLGEIRREHAQFMGFSEQDAQELLISLLASMKKQEAERQKRVLPAALGIEDRRRPTPAEQALAQRFKIAANHTVVDSIFGGQLLCCIRCTECNHRSFTFEAFMDLSLSLNTTPKGGDNTGGKFAAATANGNVNKKFANSSSSGSAGGTSGNSNSRNKGYKNKKNKSSHQKQQQQQQQVVVDGGEEGEDWPLTPPPPMPMEEEEEDDLAGAGASSMTPRQRKDKRAAKKAAKRQARLVARDQAAKEQQQAAGSHLALDVGRLQNQEQDDDADDGFKSGSSDAIEDDEEVDEGDDEEEEEEEDQDSTGAVDGGMSSPEMQLLEGGGAISSTSAPHHYGPLEEHSSYWAKDTLGHHHQALSGGNDDLHQIPMDIAGDELDDDYDDHLGVGNDDGHHRHNVAMDIGSLSGDIEGEGMVNSFYGSGRELDSIDWSADPVAFVDQVAVQQLLLEQQGQQQQQEQHLGPAEPTLQRAHDLVIESLLAADISLPVGPNGPLIIDDDDEDEEYTVYGPELPSSTYYYGGGGGGGGCGDDLTLSTEGGASDSGIGGGGGGGAAVGSIDASTTLTVTGPVKEQSSEEKSPDMVDVFASGDSMDGASMTTPTTATTTTTTDSNSNSATNSPNGKSSSGGGDKVHHHHQNTPTLLPHVDAAFRSKLYELALQKVSYDGGQTNNGDLGRLFEAFIKPETLDGVNRYLCDGCTAAKAAAEAEKKKVMNSSSAENASAEQQKVEKVYTKAIRTQLIALPPAVLVVHLKRFEANSFGGRSGGGFSSTRGASYAHKLSTAVSFPERLSLAPYTSKLYEMAYAQFYESKGGEAAETEEEAEGEDDDGSQLQYQLYGVVLHSGSLRSGHYTAYVAVRPAAYRCDGAGNLERFLHLKPFVANIEHIVGVCWEKEKQEQEVKRQQQEEEAKKVVIKEEEELKMNGCGGGGGETQMKAEEEKVVVVVEKGDAHPYPYLSQLLKTEEICGKPKQDEGEEVVVMVKEEHQQLMMVTTQEEELHRQQQQQHHNPQQHFHHQHHHHLPRHYSAVNGDHNYLGDQTSSSSNSAASTPSPTTPSLPALPALPAAQRRTGEAPAAAPIDQRKWYHISDTSVQATNLAHVLRETTSPYILFYERIQ